MFKWTRMTTSLEKETAVNLATMQKVEKTLNEESQRKQLERTRLEQSFLESVQVRSVFQPIVDLYSGEPVGYEVLSRPGKPFENPVELFEAAAQLGMLWDVECVCRRAALDRIACFDEDIRRRKFFLNVSPGVLSDPRFMNGYTLQSLDEHGIEQNNIVIEITESASIFDYPNFENLLSHYKDQGFRIAIDDFGAGHASLVTMIACAPHYLKMDRSLIDGIHRTSYKQQMVRAMLHFSENTQSRLIAEGVETQRDLETLIRLGVKYAQGYFFARPEPEIRPLDGRMLSLLRGMVQRFNRPKVDLEETISNMVLLPKVVEVGSMNCEDLDYYFRSNPASDHVVIARDAQPFGLLTRERFSARTSGAFGYSLVQKKPIESVAKRDPLVIRDNVHIVELARMAMQRSPEDIYDPVVVSDEDGRLIGTITMRQLIHRASELEVVRAMESNPLTNLPGNRSIQKWISRALEQEEYSVVYIDLDNFKSYNDIYGFMKGDEMIRLCAKVLQDHLKDFGRDACLGHIGGDDFIIVAPSILDEAALQRICQAFDREKLELFDAEHIRQGGYVCCDRQGRRTKCNLVTASISIIESSAFDKIPHPAQLAKAASSLKKLTKKDSAEYGTSRYRFERRRHLVGKQCDESWCENCRAGTTDPETCDAAPLASEA
jgi:diguanylate cyclase (GGDEF)-like protein